MLLKIISTFIFSFSCNSSLSLDQKNIWFQKGNLPIILTAPHGGTNSLLNVAERKDGIKGGDIKTFELTELINNHIKFKLGKKPYIVAAKFARKYIDANRKEEKAYDQNDNTIVKKLYRDYHQQIRDIVNEINKKYPKKGLLLDIHGQKRDTDAIYIGTLHGKTVTNLINCYGKGKKGINSFFEYFTKHGYKIFPLQIGDDESKLHFMSGFTVNTYGSNNINGIDAVQLEIGRDLRSPEKLKKTAKDIADAIIFFYEKYLKN